MAEENGSEVNEEEAVQRAQAFVREQVMSTINEMRQAEAVPQQRQGQNSDQDHLRAIIDPYVKPDVDRARLESASARDESRFYRQNPDAAEMESQIEKIFDNLVSAGRPWQRADIYAYLTGKTALAEPEKFVQRLADKKKAQLQQATRGADMGYAAVGRDQDVQKFQAFDKLSTEDMEKALDGIAF